METPRPPRDRFYCAASQVRLLLELPERLWNSLEAGRFLQAARLHLLSVRLHTALQLQAGGGSPVLRRFPILVRQLATTAHFRSTILLDSRALLRGRAVSDQAIAEALVSTMLLEDSSPRQALADFLLARKASIQQLLNQPQHGAGIKAQVCSLVELLVTTLFQAYAVFYLPPEGQRPGDGALSCGLLFSTLEGVTSPAAKGQRVLQEESSPGGWFRYLPPSITEFQPTLRSLAQPIQRGALRDTLQQWIDTCKEDICGGVGGLLVYVRSLKALASIRDAVWDLLSSDSISQHWSCVCQRLLERPLLVWEDFLQQLFLQRLQAITREETEAISSSSVQLLSSALRDLEAPSSSGRGSQFEVDVASFLWSESPGDLQSDAGWVSVSQRGRTQDGGLTMKTKALTPCVQNFCSSLDAKLKERLDDLQHYLPRPDPGPDSVSMATSSSSAPPDVPSSFNRFTDSPAVEAALRDGCVSCVRHILSSIRSELAAPSPGPAPSSGPAPSPGPAPRRLSSVLFMARLSQSMGELCPNLKLCILGKQGAEAKAAPRPGRKAGKGRGAAEATPAQAEWAGLREELLACSMAAYGIWSAALSTGLLDPFGSALLSDSPGSILQTATHWEDLEIQEEAESGTSVTSRIRLPVQPSWFVQQLLFQLCVEVNKVGGHALPRPTMHQLMKSCLDQALDHYHTLTQTHNKDVLMSQTRALQLLFDLSYLNSSLSIKQDEAKTCRSSDPRFQQVSDWLESFIDPFDLDVFTPLLNNNLSRMCQRTAVLLGLLTGSEKHFSSRGGAVSSQEPHGVLPLASSQIRFGLLPLSMSSVHKPRAVSRGADVLQLTPPSSSSDSSFRPGSLFRQFVDEDPSAPSLFKLSWLSGISK